MINPAHKFQSELATSVAKKASLTYLGIVAFLLPTLAIGSLFLLQMGIPTIAMLKSAAILLGPGIIIGIAIFIAAVAAWAGVKKIQTRLKELKAEFKGADEPSREAFAARIQKRLTALSIVFGVLNFIALLYTLSIPFIVLAVNHLPIHLDGASLSAIKGVGVGLLFLGLTLIMSAVTHNLFKKLNNRPDTCTPKDAETYLYQIPNLIYNNIWQCHENSCTIVKS